MVQRLVISQTGRPEATSIIASARWMQHFFTEDVSPDNHPAVELQLRAVWIGLAFILQAINEINPGWYMPHLAPFGSLIPFTLILSSFFAMWMAFRPSRTRRQGAGKQGKGKPRPYYTTQNLAEGESVYSRGEACPRPAVCPRPARWQHVVLVLTLLLTIAGGIQFGRTLLMCFLPPQFSNDGTSLDTNAAMLLLQGRNPYTDSNMLDMARNFPIQPNWTTPLRQGQFAGRLDYPTMVEFQTVLDTDLKAGQAIEFESKVSYPALSFLTLVPFALFKDYNVLPFYLLSYLLLVAIAWKVARTALRSWILLFSMANVSMWSSVVGGNLDIFYALLIVLVWLFRDHKWRSALFLGLALASKQIAWFFIPFYIIMVWRHYSLKEALYRLLIAGSIGLAINLPFILWNPQAWVAGILAPIADPMFPMGIGLISLSTAHLLPYFPIWVYTALEACAMLCAIAVYWRLCRTHPEAAMLLAVVPLFFAWRSLPSYFSCAAFPLFVLMAAKRPLHTRRVVAPAPALNLIASLSKPTAVGT